MKTRLRSIIIAITAVIGVSLSVLAATPVAVWDGDFNVATKGDYTLTANGNTVASDGKTITINRDEGTTSGVKIDWTNGIKPITVVVRYNNTLTTADSLRTLIVANVVNANGARDTESLRNRAGVNIKSGSMQTVGYWQGSTGGRANGVAGFNGNPGCFVFNYNANAGAENGWGKGTNLRQLVKDELVTVHAESGCVGSGDNTIGVTIGGNAVNKNSNCTGLVISGIAIFDSAVPEEDLKTFYRSWNYKSVLSLNFGASGNDRTVATATDPNGAVHDSNWYNFNQANMTDAAAGSATVTTSAPGHWQNDNKTQSFMKGYFDDHSGGTPQTISIAVGNLTGARYDVYIYCSSDNSQSWVCKNINGVDYSWSSDHNKAIESNSVWGNNSNVNYSIGNNVLLVKNVVPDNNGKITITSLRESGNRGSIAAVQLGELDALKTYTATISANTNWNDIQWSPAGEIEDDSVLELTVNGNPEISFAANTYVPQHVKFIGAPVLKADDSAYTDGCWIKSIVEFDELTVGGATAATTIKSGFVGAYLLNASGLSLRAQNREVISINVGGGSGTGDSPSANIVPSDDNYYGLAPVKGSTWNNISKAWQSGPQTITLNGATAASANGSPISRPTIDLLATAKNTWQYNCTDPFLSGYLDDGSPVNVSVHGVPYTQYDVIVYATSDAASNILQPITVNGKTYTSVNGETIEGSSHWGVAQQKTAVFGKNALYIAGLTGEQLSISASRNGNPRATICAVQVICQGDVVLKDEFTTTISSSTTFGNITWDGGKTFAENQLNEATITVSGSGGEVALTFDNPNVLLGKLVINSSRDIRLVGTAALPNVGQLILSGCTGNITFDWPATTIETRTGNHGYTYVGGAGAANARVGIEHNGGSATLGGGTFYLGETNSDTDSTININGSNTVVNYGDALGIGKATYHVGGNAQITAAKFILAQGKAERNSVFTLSDNASVTISGNENGDRNTSSVIFGHWNGSTSFTMSDNSVFSAANAEVLVGLTRNDHTINLNGGTFTAKAIKASTNATGVNTLNLNGATLNLGANGISAYNNSNAISVNVNGDSTITATEQMLTLSQPFTIAENKTLTVNASTASVNLTGVLGGSGTLAFSGDVDFADTSTFIVAGATVTASGNVSFNDTLTVKVSTAIPNGGIRIIAGGVYGVLPTLTLYVNNVETQGYYLTTKNDGLYVLSNTPATEDWPTEPSSVSGRSALDAFGNGIPSALQNVDAGALADWAKSNGVDFANKSNILPDAFLLNCANTQAAIDSAKADFAITGITFVNGTVQISPDNGANYGKGKVVIKGKSSLSDTEWGATNANTRFYKAFLEARGFDE